MSVVGSVAGRDSPRPDHPERIYRAGLSAGRRHSPAPRPRLQRGRFADQPARAIVNQDAASVYWSGEDAVGKRVRFFGEHE